MSGAKKLLRIDGTKKFKLNTEELRVILPQLQQRFKCIVIFGKNRGGKSYIMNVFRKKIENDAGSSLTGFYSKTGSRGVTNDFWVMTANKKLEDYSFLLCDTEGAFEVGKTAEISAKLLAISATISSCLIINIKQALDAAELNFFNAFLANVTKGNSEKFNELVFLVRDWGYPDEYSFGLEGGNEYLASLKDENLEKILSLFKKSQCYLMPSIGYKQVKDPKYCSAYKIETVDPEFDEHCEKFVDMVIMNVEKEFRTILLQDRLMKIISNVNRNERLSLFDIQRANDEIIILKERLATSVLEAERRCDFLMNELNTLKDDAKVSKETENFYRNKVENLEKEINNINDMRQEMEKEKEIYEKRINELLARVRNTRRRGCIIS